MLVMARQLRIQYPGAIYHVMNRGDRREAIFREDADREALLAAPAEACSKTARRRCQPPHDSLKKINMTLSRTDPNGPFLTITSAIQLGDLLNLVHDRWFNVEQVVFDKEQKTVALHLERKKAELVGSSKDGIGLLIKNVESLTINDTEKVRDYDVNKIKFDAASGRLIITGGIPITIEVKVTALNIELVSAAT